MITTLAGSNDFLRQSELQTRLQTFITNHGEMSVEQLDGEEVPYSRITDALSSLPFLTQKKLVVLYRPSAAKAFTEQYETILAGVSELIDVVIIEPQLDKRLGYTKFLQKQTTFVACEVLDARGLATWITGYVKEHGGAVDTPTSRLLIDRLGTNQRLLRQELDKLLLYDPHITPESVELLTEAVPQSTIFELLDAAFHGNTKKALRLYDEQRALKVEPQQLLALITWQLQVIAYLKIRGTRSVDEVAREAKLNPFVLRKSESIARRLPAATFQRLLRDALAIDVRLKTAAVDADELLQYYLLTLAGS